MTLGPSGSTHERRESLAELDAGLRDRLLRLDEPVDWSDWAGVVERSKASRRSRNRSLALVGSGATALALALALALVLLLPGAGQPRSGAAAHPLPLQVSSESGLLLTAEAQHASFVDNSDGRFVGQALTKTSTGSARSAAIVRSLSAGPFRVPAGLVRATPQVRHPQDGPLPGDQAILSFYVLASTGPEPTAGSAVMTCQYGFDRTAYCDGAVDLEDGVQLTASGTLDGDTNHLTLVVTSGNTGDGNGRDVLEASPRPGTA